MSAHLLALSIGPVQSFIAAARRTRDLWLGSRLLSQISAAAARAVADGKGKLIFPHDIPPKDAEGVANIVLAELHGVEPGPLAAAAEKAALRDWRRIADQVFDEHRDKIDEGIWRSQSEDVIEFHAAWVPFTEYKNDRARLMRLLAGRKNCRDFLPGHGRAGVWKSSLDGLRESVLKKSDKSGRGLRLRRGEELDIVGVVKRVAGGHKPYPSVARVAADPWLRGIADHLGPLDEECRKLGNEVIRRIDIDSNRLHDDYARFPYDGTAVYRSRHPDIADEAGDPRPDLTDLGKALSVVERIAKQPDPYLAVLVADGDKMGEAIGNCETPAENRDLSSRLAAFASAAHGIVTKRHGVLVYAGGDDVLAFLPLDEALACARGLYDAFKVEVRGTLSVGVAIGHFYEDLEDLLDYGRAAEKHAKRDGLAVHLHKRGGAPVLVRRDWHERPDERLMDHARWFRDDAVSGRIPYELHRLAAVYDDWPDDEARKAALRADALRVIAKKNPGGEESRMTDVGDAVGRIVSPDGLRSFANGLLIARQLAVALRQSEVKP
ncbi:MAG: type III-B CRISPR-associated protein Cas10/Cmr2 [Gemmataceae bacterium]|nr:type III-B CRISPR-associated protein Cas10/Cmr2 [Gemmataceae bacterium]